MVYEANVNKTLHYIKYCLLNNILKVDQYGVHARVHGP